MNSGTLIAKWNNFFRQVTVISDTVILHTVDKGVRRREYTVENIVDIKRASYELEHEEDELNSHTCVNYLYCLSVYVNT